MAGIRLATFLPAVNAWRRRAGCGMVGIVHHEEGKTMCPIRIPAAFAAALVAALPAAAQDLGSGRWIDLTHPFNEESVYWPTAEIFELEEVFHGQTEGGWYYTAYNFSAAEHGGTHLDAPIHFAEGGADRRRDPGRADDRPGLRHRRERGRGRGRRLPDERRRHRGLRGRARQIPEGRSC